MPFGLPWKRPVDDGTLVGDLISQPVLWFLVVVFIATSSALLGVSIPMAKSYSVDLSYYSDPSFYNLLWQTILQLLASYISLVPVLRERRKRARTGTEKQRRYKITYDVVFYGSIIISILMAIMAPISYVQQGKSYTAGTYSNTFNFISTIFSTIAASQLAGRIEDGEFTSS